MGIEIERKFLVTDDSWEKPHIKGCQIKQGYLKNSSETTVRIRVMGEKGYITVKGRVKSAFKDTSYVKKDGDAAEKNITNSKNNITIAKLEFEYEIPLNDALEMLELCEKPLIEKMRYKIDFMGFEWCIDLFEGDNQGLIIAEIELQTEEQQFIKPSWAGEEVSGDPRYLNSNLIKKPFSNW